MDPLNPMAATLSPAIAEIYERAHTLKSELRTSVMPLEPKEAKENDVDELAAAKQARARNIACMVLNTPERLRLLVAEGRIEEARRQWQAPLALLERWKAEGKGGNDVQDCIDDGEAALRGEPPDEKSWININNQSSGS